MAAHSVAVSWQTLVQNGQLTRAVDKEDPAFPAVKKLRIKNLRPLATPYTLRLRVPCTCGSCIVPLQIKAGGTRVLFVWNEDNKRCDLHLNQLTMAAAEAPGDQGVPPLATAAAAEPVAAAAALQPADPAAPALATLDVATGVGGESDGGGDGMAAAEAELTEPPVAEAEKVAAAAAAATAEAQPLSARNTSSSSSGSATKPVLCGNTFERDGGVFGCVLPAGHAGPHELLSSKRARKLPQNFWGQPRRPSLGAAATSAAPAACEPVPPPLPAAAAAAAAAMRQRSCSSRLQPRRRRTCTRSTRRSATSLRRCRSSAPLSRRRSSRRRASCRQTSSNSYSSSWRCSEADRRRDRVVGARRTPCGG